MFAPQQAPAPNGNNTGDNASELARRQQMLRFGLIIFLLFLMLDNKQPPGNRDSDQSFSEKEEFAEVPLNAAYGTKINSILNRAPEVRVQEHAMNGTGLYRGTWVATQHLTNTSVDISGTALLQLVSVPVRAVPDVSFVYGLLHLYKSVHRDQGGAVHVSLETGFPLQGVMVSSQQRLVLFSTPYRSQRLYLRIASAAHYNASSGSASGSASAAAVGTHQQVPAGRKRRRVLRAAEEGEGLLSAQMAYKEHFGAGPLSSADVLLHGDLPMQGNQVLQSVARRLLLREGSTHLPESALAGHGRRASELVPADNSSLPTLQLVQGLLSALGIEGVAAAQPREVRLTPLTAAGYLSVVLTDQPLQQKGSNTTANNSPNNTTVAQIPTSGSNNTAGNNTEDGGLNGSDALPQTGDFLLSIAVGEALLPARFKAMQSAAQPPSLVATAGNRSSTSGVSRSGFLPGGCQYTAQLKATSRSSAAPTDPGKVTLPADILPELPVPSSGDSAPPPSAPQSVKAVKFEPVLEVEGTASSLNCGREYSLHTEVFNLELGLLKSKADLYALVATFLSLAQIFLTVFQLKHASTQAMASRVSIMSVFAQSLLDANLCMVHLLLSFAFPAIFFAAFIWIALLKLLLFSVFQMRMIISIYQARYAQEMAGEGWAGMRARLITLHARFYGAVLLVLLLSIVFYNRPVVAVLAMYSFWVPQIAHSTYTGTKHALHPAYLVGTSLSRCFIPLYFLGCPNNFLAMLAVYVNPQYLAVLSDSAASAASGSALHHAGSLADLPAASVSACWVLVLWTAAQVGVLLLQSAFGPRFFVPKQWLPQRYDYRRPIPASIRPSTSPSSTPAVATATASQDRERNASGDIAMTGIRSRATTVSRPGGAAGAVGGTLSMLFGARRAGQDGHGEGGAGVGDDADLETGSLLGEYRGGLPGASSTSLNSSSGSGGGGASNAAAVASHELECVICYNAINVSTGDYMVTPCDHVFHEGCLTQWADVKLECPVCRSVLPAIGEDLH